VDLSPRPKLISGGCDERCYANLYSEIRESVMTLSSSFVETASAVAGIGGLAISVFLILSREIIRKNIFPNLTRLQAYKIIRLIIILSFVVSMAGLGAWIYNDGKEDKPVQPKLTWVRSSDDSVFKWDLKNDGGPVYNLEADLVQYLSFTYFPPGVTSIKNSAAILISPFPLYSDVDSKRNRSYHMDFTASEYDVGEIAKDLGLLLKSNSGARGSIEFVSIVMAEYESEAGVKFQRAWDFSKYNVTPVNASLRNISPSLINVNRYREEEVGYKMLFKCHRALNSPTFEDQEIGDHVDWVKVMQTPTCSKAKSDQDS
jgi:hypothetical protein